MPRYKITAVIAAFAVFFLGFPAYAQDSSVKKLTMEEAVRIGLENSIALKQVENQMEISDLTLDRAKYQSKKLKDADEKIDEGRSELNKAKNALDSGYLPEDIVLPNGMVLKKGTEISKIPLDEETKNKIVENIQQKLGQYEESLTSGQYLIDMALEEAGVEFSEKLSFESLKSLDIDSTRDLMTTMAEISNEVTNASYDIYKNQIALLIQNSYYDVLKAQKMVEVKQKAVERAQKQYDLALESYNVGMMAKDEMLLAQIYLKKTQLEYEKALGDLNNAMIEFKKNIDIPQDTEVELTDVMAEEVIEEDLEQGLKEGIASNLEVKKAFGQFVVNDLSFNSVKKIYPDNTFQYREAALLREKARLEYEKAKADAERSIRKSYETMKTAGQMLKLTQEMIDHAQEVLDIAIYKYTEGFGQDNSLLKQLNLESASGTIVEVLAAEENLAQVEEKVVEIIYGYNLARMKYLNDIGKFLY